jgi:hypothetical protein
MYLDGTSYLAVHFFKIDAIVSIVIAVSIENKAAVSQFGPSGHLNPLSSIF